MLVVGRAIDKQNVREVVRKLNDGHARAKPLLRPDRERDGGRLQYGKLTALR